MRFLDRLLSAIERAFVFVAGVSLILMMVLTTFDLLSRKFLDCSVPGLYEFSEDYLVVSLVVLALSYVYAIGGHMRVTLFVGLIASWLNAIWGVAHNAMAFVLFAVIGV